MWDSWVPDIPICLFDLEADSLDPNVIHCVSYTLYVRGVKTDIISITDYAEMMSLFSKNYVFMGHNIAGWDIPMAIEKLLFTTPLNPERYIDTLWLSRFLFPEHTKHGLDPWGDRLGVSKPVINDWEGLDVSEYIHRCEEDVEINRRLMDLIFQKLSKLYSTEASAYRFIWFMSYITDTVSEQERSKWLLDVDLANKSLLILSSKRDKIISKLIDIMPDVPVMKTKTKPKVWLKKDGTLSKKAVEWKEFLDEHKINGDPNLVKYAGSYVKGNPNSHTQIKDWLFDMGWSPCTYKYKDGRQIPQVRSDSGNKKELAPSVKLLFKKQPDLEYLDELSTLTHRISLFEGFLENKDEDNYLKATAMGTTSTLRLRHRVIVNLPGVSKPYGEQVRGCLISPEGYELCGSDLSSLESRTRDHFIYDLDPKYVHTMMDENYCPHVELSVLAGGMSQQEADIFKEEKKKQEIQKENYVKGELYDYYVRLKDVRHAHKQAYYSCQYGVGAFKLSKALGISEYAAKKIITAYWKRNWAVKKFADSLPIRKLDNGESWIWNPLAKMWVPLRSEKDKFSAVNQSAGVYVFMSWIKSFRRKRRQLTGTFHDEVVLTIKEGNREACEKMLRQPISRCTLLQII